MLNKEKIDELTKDNKLYRGITINPNTFERVEKLHSEVKELLENKTPRPHLDQKQGNSSLIKSTSVSAVKEKEDNIHENFEMVEELNKDLVQIKEHVQNLIYG